MLARLPSALLPRGPTLSMSDWRAAIWFWIVVRLPWIRPRLPSASFLALVAASRALRQSQKPVLRVGDQAQQSVLLSGVAINGAEAALEIRVDLGKSGLVVGNLLLEALDVGSESSVVALSLGNSLLDGSEFRLGLV
jgi:hypothetical protein